MPFLGVWNSTPAILPGSVCADAERAANNTTANAHTCLFIFSVPPEMRALRADYRRRVVPGLVLSQDMENIGSGRPEFQGTHFAHRGIRQGVVNSADMSRRKSLLG